MFSVVPHPHLLFLRLLSPSPSPLPPLGHVRVSQGSATASSRICCSFMMPPSTLPRSESRLCCDTVLRFATKVRK
eukprot:964989-Pyramimonas_sp.AAC.1